MLFMTEYEIDDYRRCYRGHPVLGPATATLAALRDAANANSDGWCYWPKPARAAAKLMLLVYGPRVNDVQRDDATPAALRAAYSPIKAFRTRTGIDFPIYEAV